jgi:hypothetical protein
MSVMELVALGQALYGSYVRADFGLAEGLLTRFSTPFIAATSSPCGNG